MSFGPREGEGLDRKIPGGPLDVYCASSAAVGDVGHSLH